MPDDDSAAWPAGHDAARVTVELLAEKLAVSDDRRRTATAAHRHDVLQRLLHRGVTPGTLHQLFPGWSRFIDVAVRHHDHERGELAEDGLAS